MSDAILPSTLGTTAYSPATCAPTTTTSCARRRLLPRLRLSRTTLSQHVAHPTPRGDTWNVQRRVGRSRRVTPGSADKS
eukprot:4339832-Prymnesium_polylepis.1